MYYTFFQVCKIFNIFLACQEATFILTLLNAELFQTSNSIIITVFQLMQNHLITVIIPVYSFNQNKLYIILLIDTCKYKYFSQMKLNEFKKVEIWN